VRPPIMRKQLLQEITRTPHRLVIIRREVNQIRIPLDTVEVAERGRIAGHADDGGVAFCAEQVDALADDGEEAGRGDVFGWWGAGEV
jgi:hypothetical protein